jgi:DNA-binding LacI/PurR family transcriptional regulator
MAVTIKNVAEQAGVSVATVSYVLNESAPVSQRTRERVLKAIAELDYRPSYQGRSLRGRQSRTLGLLLPQPVGAAEELLPAALLAGLSAATTASGYHLLIASAVPGDEPELCRELATTGRVDGMVLLDPRRADERLALLAELHLPHVCLGRAPQGSQTPSVGRDLRAGMLRAVSYLAHTGHRRIGLIQQPIDDLESADWYIGYRRALRAMGLPYSSELVLEGDSGSAGSYNAMEALLAQPEPPTAVIACGVDLALGALSAASAAGVVVGRNLALVASGDSLATAGAQPPLTTLRWPEREIGRALGQVLLAAVAGEMSGRRVAFEPQLIIRASSSLSHGARSVPEEPYIPIASV